METQNEAAAQAAADAVVHPTDPPQPIEPVPEPHGSLKLREAMTQDLGADAIEKATADVGDPSVEAIEEPPPALEEDEFAEIIDVRESALEEIEIQVNVIPPTVGRQVWFRKSGADLEGQPEAATIVYVHSEHMLNLQVISPDGNARGETSVPLVHDGEERPEGGHFAEWMPFQKGQARAASPFGERLVGIGDDVYYGVGDCHFHIAKVTHINEDQTVDLVVFERERDHRVFNVAKADLGQPGCINGWAFKA